MPLAYDLASIFRFHFHLAPRSASGSERKGETREAEEVVRVDTSRWKKPRGEKMENDGRRRKKGKERKGRGEDEVSHPFLTRPLRRIRVSSRAPHELLLLLLLLLAGLIVGMERFPPEINPGVARSQQYDMIDMQIGTFGSLISRRVIAERDRFRALASELAIGLSFPYYRPDRSDNAAQFHAANGHLSRAL